MIDHQQPVPSEQLQIYQALSGRMNFSKDEYKTYQMDLKGFSGEALFAKMIKRDLKVPYHALYSLLYEESGNHFQPDCILLVPNRLYLLEIKNYEGEYEYRNHYLYSHTFNKNYRDPVEQLMRGNLLLENMLQRLNIPLQIQTCVIFINPSFTLFQANPNPNIILPTQFKGFLQHLNNIQGHLPTTYRTYAQRLLSQHRGKSPFTKVPNYSFDRMQKGILCFSCRHLMKTEGYKFHCPKCSALERNDSAFLRMLIEFDLLFPTEKITTKKLYHWYAGTISSKTINRMLSHFLHVQSNGKATNYTFHRLDKPS